MEDLLLGFGSFILLAQITNLIVVLCKRFQDNILGIAGGMVGIDMVAMVVYGYAFKPFSENVRLAEAFQIKQNFEWERIRYLSTMLINVNATKASKRIQRTKRADR